MGYVGDALFSGKQRWEAQAETWLQMEGKHLEMPAGETEKILVCDVTPIFA